MSEDIKNKIRERLLEMGSKNIAFDNLGDDIIIVRFDCDDLTSFSRQFEGWVQLGIELNDKGSQAFKIVFLKQVQVDIDVSTTNQSSLA